MSKFVTKKGVLMKRIFLIVLDSFGIDKDNFKRLPMGEESERLSKWNLLDYGEVVIHIMNQEQRDIYKIEKFWSHALTLEREVWEEQSKEFAKYES